MTGTVLRVVIAISSNMKFKGTFIKSEAWRCHSNYSNKKYVDGKKDGEVLDCELDLYHLGDMLASQYQVIDCTQQTTCQEVSHTGDREPVTQVEK